MKKHLLFICLIFSVTLFAQKAALPIVKLKKGNVKLNKTIVTKDWKLSGFTNTLGKPERERDGANKTHTYDKYGIVLFEPKNDKKEPSGTISEFQFYFSVPEPNVVTPTGVYTNNIKIDKLIVNAGLTSEKMKKALKKWTSTESYLEHSFRMQYKLIYVYFQFDQTETKLIKLSVGKVKP
jgi:hypothetical protein